ncbi:hypothetical protein LBW78_10490 [Rothia kristinae]|uniref:FtsK/SpoIIIE domain-containing protein n=1 Tax=Rothia kristinae TaxID=37923 RepID=UPI001CD3A079|nr:FtsK/SpoIIIE domain-containing protein [Rothia kristinae]MCA1170804.1 hypothetical protein [Rothia kristinae]
MAKNDTDRTTGEEVALTLAAFAWKTLCTWWVTLSWGALFVFAYQEAFLWFPILALAAVGACSWWRGGVWRLAVPFWGDALRIHSRRTRRKELSRGNQWLRDAGLVSVGDETVHEARLQVGEDWEVLTAAPIPGVSPARWSEAAEQFRGLRNAAIVEADALPDGVMRVTFYRSDALDEPWILDAPPAVDLDTMSVEAARNRAGAPVPITFKEQAALLAGGIGGSGKTAGLATMLSAFAQHPEDVELTILDGKAGTDWQPFAPVARRYLTIADTSDLRQARDILAEAVEEMTHRVATSQEALHCSNFWKASAAARRAASRPWKVIVIDECQELFTGAVPKSNKEAREIAAENEQLVTTLIKRGRSAGITLILLTQKPTTDSIPSGARDNAGLKIGFRVETKEAEKAILGTSPDDPSAPSATAIPRSRVGGAVLVSDRGVRENVRFGYLDEHKIRSILRGEDD